MHINWIGKSSELKLHCFCLFDAYSMPKDIYSAYLSKDTYPCAFLLRWITKTTKTSVLVLASVVLALITLSRKHVGDPEVKLEPKVNHSMHKGQKLWWQSQDGSEDLLWVNWTSIINVLVWYGYIEKEWLPLWLSHCNFRYSESLWTRV